MKKLHRKNVAWIFALAISLFTMPSFAAPTAVDDNVAVLANTPVLANDLSANDTNLPTDIYTITVSPTNGTATLTTDGQLDYSPNIGFASTDTLTYSIDDGAGGVDTATVNFDVVLNSDFLTPGNNFIIGQEDIPTPLNLSVDESLENGGTLQDIIAVDALYRASDLGGTSVVSTIPTGTTGIKITGYATRSVGTSQVDSYNDDYELLTVNIDLREGTYSGRLTYSTSPSNNSNDQYTWLNVPLGQSALSDTSYASGDWTEDSNGNKTADILVELIAGQISVTETNPLQIAYHVEHMTSDGDSADFISASGAVQTPGEFISTFDIPSELEPTDGSAHGYLVLTGNSAADGVHYAMEHKGFGRMVVNLETNTVSGVIASERGELDSIVTTWAFKDYSLVDLRDTPTAIPVAITASTASTVGDSTAPGSGSEDDPIIYIDATGQLTIERATDHANAFTTMYTIENYRRTGLSSIASFVGVVSDTSLFDASPADDIDDDGKLVNVQTFAIPASASIGLVEMSWQTIGGTETNENVGYGFAVIDLNDNSSSGSITFSRSKTPDLVAWQGVPIGTTMFGATDGGVDLYQSNKASNGFTDYYPATAIFTLEDNADGSRTLKFTATSTGNGTFRDYDGTTQVSWLGSEPFSVEGVPVSGTLSHGSPTDSGGWEVDFADIPNLTISTNEHGTGELRLDLVLASTGELDSIIVHVEPVVDDPIFAAPDVVGYADNPVALGISIGDSADVDGSETQLETLTLSGVPTNVMLSASAGIVTNFGGGNWQVDNTAVATLSATGPITPTTTITATGTNIDTDDLDGDGVIEDVNNGAGVDELDSVTYELTFELTILEVPTVTSQETNTGTPIISGTAIIGSDESLLVTVNGVTYTNGDGNLVVNGDGTWDLTIPGSDTIADGTYVVIASINHIDGGTGVDTTTDELIIDATPPVTPTVIPLTTSDATPTISGTAVVNADEVLAVTVNGITYTAGDGNLIDNGDGTWVLAITSPLSEGVFDVTTTVIDAAGNISIDTTLGELTVEATPASTPTVVALTTSDTTPTITGNAVVESGSTLSVTVDGVTYVSGDGNLVHNSSGLWTLSLTSTMADGTYEVVATITDIFGNQYPDTSSDELVIDTTAPATPTVTSQITNNTTPTISGTAIVGAGEVLTVVVNGVTYTAGDGNLIDNGDGSWDLMVPVALAASTYSVTATLTDSVGNAASDSSVDELIIDTVPPAIPTVSFQTTSNATPIISGTATMASDETLSVSVGGITYTAGDGNLVDNGDGTWDLTMPTALADGDYSVTATIFDAAGNSSVDATALELTIDTLPPVTPTVTSQSTNSTSPTINGTATIVSGDTLSVTVDGTTYIAGDGNLVDNGDGTWVLTVPATLDEGIYDVTTTVTDIAGNATDDLTAGELIIDLTAPTAPGVTSQGTTDTTPVVEGTATVLADETLSVEVNGILYIAGDGDLIDNGDGTWALTIPATNILAEALYQVVATVTDAAGNSASDPGLDDLVVDLTVPISPGVTSQTTNNTTPVIEGSAIISTGDVLSVTVDGTTYTAGDGNLVVNSDSTWTLSVPVNMVEGLYDVTATIVDLAGNTSSDPSSGELLIDTTPPVTPSTTLLTTSNTTPTLEGTANAGPGEILTVSVNGVTYTAGDGNLIDYGDGTWALSIPTPLPDGTYEVEATITDAAGNSTSDANTNELVIDTTDPIVPTVNVQVTNNNTPVISGTTSVALGEILTVVVNGITYVAGDGNLVVNSDGTWDLTIPLANTMVDGTYEVAAYITDIAGNVTQDASTTELLVDTIVPSVPTVTALVTSNTTPTISGTATIAAGEILTVIVNGATYIAGDGNLVDNGDGTWTLSIPVSLADATYEVVATITDAAGNVSHDATASELIVDTIPPIVPAVVSQNTSNTSPIITGTATIAPGETLTVTVDGATYTAGDGNLVDNGDGSWELSVPTTLADNTYVVTVSVTDAAGNTTSDITTDELIIDTTAPVTPTVTALNTNNATPTIEGTATVTAGETLTVTVDGTTYTAGDGSLVDNGDGTWALSIPVTLFEDTYEVLVTVTDTAGNSTNDVTATELVVDLTAPVAPGVTSLTTSNATPVIEGTATVAPGEILSVEVNGVIYVAGDGNLVDNADGTWTLTIPAADALAENLYQVIATVTDAAGNSATDSGVDDLLVDFTAPITPGVTSLTTNNTTPVIEGTATVGLGETLSVEVNGITYIAGDGNLVDNGDGTWALSIPVALAEGLYDVTASITDTAGNVSFDPSSSELLIDTTLPITPAVVPQITSDTTPIIQGTANAGPGETLTVTVDGVTYIAGDGNLIDDGNGRWALQIPQPMVEGTYEVVATVIDAAGNQSTDTNANELVIDITDPIAPTVNALTTNITNPVLTGTTSTVAGETLTVAVNGITYTAGDGFLVDNGGTWDLTIPVANAIPEGSYEVIAMTTDLAGNTTNDATVFELLIDTTAPVVPTVTALNTSNTTPTLLGTATLATGETLSVTLEGVTYTAGDGNLVDNGDGTWELSVPTPLPDNTYPVTVSILDAAGNVSDDVTTSELVVDTVAPVAPTVLSQTTSNTTPLIEGTATIATGETLTVMVDGINYVAGDGNLTDNGDGTWSLIIPTPLADATYNVIATVTDSAGNATDDATATELIIDTIDPAVPTVIDLYTSIVTPTISGTATVGTDEILSVEVNGTNYVTGDGFLVDNGDGTWNLLIPTPLADGVYEVVATVTDAAGNLSSDITVDELTIDTTAPVTPTSTALNTNSTSPTITGTATVGAGEILTVTVDGTTYTAGDGSLIDNGDGTWALSIPTSLPEGVFDVTTTVTDAAGNSTTDVTAGELIIDLTAPVAPGVTSLTTSNTTPTIEGTATIAPGETLSVEVNGVVYVAGDGNLIDNGDGTWELTIPATDALAENIYQVVATVTDAAGNSTTDSAVDDLLIDFTAPITPGVTSLTTNDTTPIIEGTATIAAGEILSVEVNGITYIAGDGNLLDNGDGTWTLSIPVVLAEGLYDVTATITDAAGNVSVDPSASELLIDTTIPITPTVVPQFTSDTTPVIVGTANVGTGETLTVTVSGVTYTAGDGNLVDNGDGTWALTIPVPLPEGTYEVTATVKDAATNQSTDTNSNELVIDTTDPIAPTVNTLITNLNTPTLSGTTSTVAGESLSVLVNGITYTSGDGNLVVNSDGTWDLNIPTANAMVEGNYEVIATTTDLAGNATLDTSAFELIIDTTAPTTPTVTALNTSNTTPIISGTATVAAGETLTVIVDGTTYTAGDGNLVDNGDGTWALSIPNALPDNTYAVTVSVLDAAGNFSDDITTSELVIDTVVPVTPTVVSQITSNTTPTIEGTATVAPGETLTVTVDGISYIAGDSHLTDNGDGTWALTIPVPLADAAYDVVVTVTDGAGNASTDATATELIIDTIDPVVPTVIALNTSVTTPTISGTATVAADEALSVEVNGITYVAGDGNLVDNGDGTWDLSIPTPLAEGTYEVTAIVTDAAGNLATDVSVDELVIDTTDPVTPTSMALNTNSTSPTITGTATVAAGETLTVTVDGTTYTAGDGHLIDNSDGTWSLSIPVSLIEGVFDVTTTITDTAGNATSDVTIGELIIDLTAPIAPGVTSLTTADPTPVITGTATITPGEILTVEVNSVIYTAGDGNLIDNGDGTWTLNIPATDALPENLYQVVATVTDLAGNSTIDSAADDLLVDFTAPETPGVTSLTTNNTTPVITGTAIIAPGETLSVTVNGITYIAGDGDLVDNGDGTWTLSIPVALAEGIYDVMATIIDTAGNMSTDASTGELLIDTTPPTTPSVVPQFTSDTTPVIEGTANAGPGETLSVSVDGVTYIAGDGNLIDNGDGTWVLNVPVPSAEGTYEVVATVTDAAGNESTDTNTNELVIDTTFPIVPTVNTLITNINTPVLTGTASTVAGETLTVAVNGIIYTAGDGNLVVNNDGTWDLTIPLAGTISEGTYEVLATTTDLAGNTTADASALELIIDTTVPVVPTVTALNTSNTTPTISGTATLSPDETLSVTVNGVTYTAGDGNLVDNGDGTWDLALPTALADDLYPVTVTIIDAAGNSSSDITTSELVIDTTAPPAPTVTSQVTSDTTPVIVGTATVALGETLTVIVDGTTYTAGDGYLTYNVNGTWTLSVRNALAEGTYDIVATITDSAGNATSDATIAELLIDTTDPVIPTVTALTTNVTTPNISGTATIALNETLTVTVDGVLYTAGDGNLIDNGDGTWDLFIPNALSDNIYSVTTTVIDAAGNASDDITISELIIDTVPPPVPTVVSQITNNTTPIIEGSAILLPGEILTVTVDGISYEVGDGFLVDNGDDTWSLLIPAQLAEGTYEVIATITEIAGNQSTDVTHDELIIDITPPVTPTVTALNTNSTSPTITGTATVEAGDTLTVTVDGTTYTAGDGNLIDNGDGTWALSIPVSLSEGAFDITVTVTDTAGNSTDDLTAGELIIDVTAPVAPGVTSLTTSDATPTIEGTATIGAGEILSVEVNGVMYVAGDGNLVDNGDGTWALTIPATDALTESLYQVVATVTDAAGNTTIDSGTDDLLIDFTAPITPGVTSLTTNNTTPIIEGTATVASGETLSVAVNGITYVAGDGNLVNNNDGTWTLTIPVPLAEGLYDVTASIIDTAGNISTDPSSGELLIDTTLPTTPAVEPQITSDTTPVIEGTANAGPGETLSVTVDGVTYVAGDGNLVDNGDGTWALTIPVPLAEGAFEVIATVTDAAGNQSTDTNTNELVIDTTDPIAPTINMLITNLNTPVLTGTTSAIAGEILTVVINGTTYVAGDGDLVVNSDGTWALTIPLNNAIAEGVYEVLATITDLAGNTTIDISTSELVIDNTIPITPTVTALNTSDTMPTIVGTAIVAPGETLNVTVDGVTYTAGDGSLVDNGDGTWSLTIPILLPDNSYAVTVIVTDAAGNSNTDVTTSELVVDTVVPVAPTVTALNTSNSTPTIEGTATVAPGEVLTVTVDGVTYVAGDGNLVDNGDGTWTLIMPTPLTDNVYDITVTITDAAGNASTDTSIDELVIDTMPPATPSVVSLNTNNTTPLIEGSALVAPGETLTVTIDGVTYTAGDGYLVDNGDGTWSLSIVTPLTEGSFDVTVTVTDEAGNFSSDTTAGEIIIDLTAPLAPGVTSLTTSDATPSIEGTAIVAPGDTLSVEVNGVIYLAGDGNLIDNGDGTWTLTINTANALVEDLYQVVATVTDVAGNSAVDPSIDDLLIDFTAPGTPGVTGLSSNDTTPTIQGTATLATGEILTVTVNGIIYVAGDGNLVYNNDGTWTLTIPQPLAEGLYDVTATITDVAGNTSSDPSSNELLIDTTLPITPTVVPLFTSDTTPTVEGTANAGPGETLSVSVAGVTYIAGDGNLIDNGDGTWTLSIPVELADDSYEVIATVTDAAGNQSSDANTGELVIDIDNPITPTVDPLVTNNNTPTLTGTTSAAVGEVLTVTVNGTTYTVGDGNLVVFNNGTWTLSIPTPLNEGLFDVTATITDLAGNSSSDPSSNELLIDTMSPTIPDVAPLTTNNATPVITFTANPGPGETLTVTVNGVTYTTGDGSLVDNGDGTWSLSLTSALPDGIYDVTTTITDEAGNSSSSNAQLLIDTTAPTTPTANPITTTDSTPTITGTATLAPGDTLSVTVDGIVYTAGDGNLIDNGDGTWTLNIPFDLDVGTYDIQVSVTDTVGNTSVSELAQVTIKAAIAGADFDGDGIPDALDLDDDNDGIPDSIEGLIDTDGDGQPDYLDLDSDNDGIADIIEVGGDDNDNDYSVDSFIDNDNNGLSDDLQLFPFDLVDTDNDGVPDFRDLDSDNDGLTDLLESGGLDSDYNGYIDDFSDSNNDGADDNSQNSDAAGRDTDKDGIPNRLDLDSDNDGLFDVVEAGSIDDGNNGIFDSMQDRDLDGIPDSVDVDLTAGADIDGDGIDDLFDKSFIVGEDTDADGIVDQFDPDANGDGFADNGPLNLTLGQALPDGNGDGEADVLDVDNGFIKTGLTGSGGCSIINNRTVKTGIDPLLLLLVLVSCACVWRRSSKRHF